MGTRADFYVGRGVDAEWLGSIAFDGDPRGIDRPVLTAGTEQAFRTAVGAFLAATDHATLPEQGWPWPWDDSRTTDYAYAFEGGRVWACCFGGEWFDPFGHEPEGDDLEVAEFPNMAARKRVTYGRRSGLMVIGPAGVIDDD